MSQPEPMRVIYDGECPFCSAYVTFAQLRKNVGEIELIDGRDVPDMIEAYASQGYDIDTGMIVELDGQIYHGGDAVWAINSLLSKNPVLKFMGHRRFVRWIYPALRAGRNAAIRLLGRKPIRA